MNETKYSNAYLPTSPGLMKPELALRHGTEAAVFIILGASTTMMGDPISNFFEPLAAKSLSSCEDSHFINATFGL